MLKIIKVEVLIILVLFLSILISHNVDLDFYNYFSYSYKNFFQQIHLKEFFENITTLGDSLWYFVISILSIIILYLLKKIEFFDQYNNAINKINYYNFLLFSSILISGIIVQIIKHLVGRPRPRIFYIENEIDFKLSPLSSIFLKIPTHSCCSLKSRIGILMADNNL